MLTILQFITFTVTSLLVFMFSSYLNFTYLFDSYKHWFYNDVHDFEVYDYIVVGAGSAGATISAKLAEYGYKVLLLEAGASAPPFIDIPLLAPLIQNTPYDWKYTTIPQDNACKSLTNNKSLWPMGKVLGGTSQLNYMLYVRGHPLDYDEWFPDFIEPTTENGGPMYTSDLQWNTDLANVILEGLKELHQDIGNINYSLNNGFMKPQLSIKNGKRWSTDELLHKNSGDKLLIRTHARVEKILMESNRAVGVQFATLNKTFKAIAKHGVVLSAGAIGTPKILMLSGIGPKDHLKNLNINVINDLPVGQYLVDHILTGIDLITLNASISFNMFDTLNPTSAVNYFLFGKGPWTFTGVEILGTFHSSFQENKSSIPDLQIMVMPFGLSKDSGIVLRKTMGISDKVYNEYFAPIANKNTITIAPVLLHPKSTGEVKLSSNNFLDPPLIDPKYLSNKDDIAVLIDGNNITEVLYNYMNCDIFTSRSYIHSIGLQFVKKLVNTDAMKNIGASIYEKHFPGCENEIFDSTKYWECYIQQLTLTSYHPAGTCRMGDVVDQTYRVYGTKNLYIVDASILPVLPSGNINAAIIMLAEKAARIIKRNTKNDTDDKKCRKPHNYYMKEANLCY